MERAKFKLISIVLPLILVLFVEYFLGAPLGVGAVTFLILVIILAEMYFSARRKA